MNKISLLALAAITAVSATAQTNVVKEAERAMKAKKPAAEVVQIITPALTDPSTSGFAQTWYVPGKASYDNFDTLFGMKRLGQGSEASDILMGNLLINGFDYFTHALPLDSVPDEKGKVKPKYSKDIVNTIAGHISDYAQAGIDMYNAKKYDEAYRLWNIYCGIPYVAPVRESLEKSKSLPNDTIFGEIAFNQALAAWQAKKLPESLAAFNYARNHSYNKKQLYDFAIAVASEMGDSTAILEYAGLALPIYGKEDPQYISQIVNYYLQKKQFDQAFNYIDKALEAEPNNAQYYVIRGVLYENNGERDNAKAQYVKAMELDPNNSQAVYNFGRVLYDEAYALNDNAPTSQAEYTKYLNEKIKPRFLEAVEALEKAYELDPENLDTLRYLENLYYNLNDEAKLEDVKNRMKGL